MNQIFKKEIGLIIESKYVIDKFLSNGGMSSELYLGHILTNNNEKIIIKIIYKNKETDAFWQRFIDETVTNQRVSGKKNIVNTLDAFGSNDEIYIIMEYVNGKTLRQYLNEHGCIIPKVAVNVFKNILIPIKTMHDFKHQIIHRDLKPENIMVSDDLTKITLIDFGISSVIDKTMASLNAKNTKCFTNESNVWGTYSYLLPDLLDYDNDIIKAYNAGITVQFDFFSLGVILYEMLVGEKPFIGSDDMKIIRLPQKFDVPSISRSNPNIPSKLENVIFRCLACKNEDKKWRYKNIDEIIKDIDEIIRDWDKPENNCPLIKPINQRIYQNYHIFNIDKIKTKQAFYKHWYFFVIVVILVITIVTITFFVFFNKI